MTNTQIKNNIQTHVIDKTLARSISNVEFGTDMKDIVDYVDQEKKFKSFIGKFTTHGLDLPTLTEIHNELFTSIVWSPTNHVSAPGNFRGVISGGAFPANKTFIPNRKFCLQSSPTDTRNVYIEAYNDIINININDGVAGINDGWIDFEIRVYN